VDRQILRITIVLGVLITLVGGTGIFASFTDRATTGTISVTSGERGRAADLKLVLAAAAATGDGVTCDPDFDGTIHPYDDLVGPLLTTSDLQPGASAGKVYLCLVNFGTAPIVGGVTVIDLTDVDQGCTGDEAKVDSCDQPADPGELSALSLIDFDVLNCSDGAVVRTATGSPAFFAGQGWTVTGAAGLAAGATLCLRINTRYRGDVTEEEAQGAQSDQATWRFAFDVVA